MNRIGTLNEGNLHNALKNYYATSDSVVERRIDGYVVDVYRGDEIFEIQTGGFSQIRSKLNALVQKHRVTLVYPLAARRDLIKTNSDGTVSKRKSPKQDTLADVFSELVAIPRLLQHENFRLQVVYVHVEELRSFHGKRIRRRNGWRVDGRRLVDVLDTKEYGCVSELLDEYAEHLPDPFNSRDLAQALNRTVRVGRQAAYCFREGGVTSVCGKQGNALLYTRIAD